MEYPQFLKGENWHCAILRDNLCVEVTDAFAGRKCTISDKRLLILDRQKQGTPCDYEQFTEAMHRFLDTAHAALQQPSVDPLHSQLN